MLVGMRVNGVGCRVLLDCKHVDSTNGNLGTSKICCGRGDGGSVGYSFSDH